MMRIAGACHSEKLSDMMLEKVKKLLKYSLPIYQILVGMYRKFMITASKDVTWKLLINTW